MFRNKNALLIFPITKKKFPDFFPPSCFFAVLFHEALHPVLENLLFKLNVWITADLQYRTFLLSNPVYKTTHSLLQHSFMLNKL